ncbi:MAG TPA: pyridoxamine 5'-phosphate oxidase [Gaiellaceae bacterium]|nr:pyridoxamine 5'-phosphate oxidase [Gaiellaceae bacterium]
MDERAQPLDETDLDPDPLRQFQIWFDDAAEVVRAPEAMAIATAADDGTPSLRMVLLKGWDERGFVFFTGYGSRKAGELGANPRAALLLFWDPLGRQVRIEGTVSRTSVEESERYFRSRPRGAQLAALASRQGRVLGGRGELEEEYGRVERDLDGADVPLPDWGGFRLVPETFEFWQHRENRLHDRLRYRRADGGWRVDRLSP